MASVMMLQCSNCALQTLNIEMLILLIKRNIDHNIYVGKEEKTSRFLHVCML